LPFLVTPACNLSATRGFVDPFRAANYLEGTTLFQWEFLSEAGGPVRASNGTAIATRSLADMREEVPDFVIVSSSWQPEAHASTAIKSALRRADHQRATLGGLDTGAFVLAYAGLLRGAKATVHYEHIDAFQELFPDTEVSEALWVFDGRRISCCGGVAATEFALHIVSGMHGAALANAAARYLFAPRLRDQNTPQTRRLANRWAQLFPTRCGVRSSSWKSSLRRL